MTEPDLIQSMSVLSLQPGDVLVVKAARPLPVATCKHIVDCVRRCCSLEGVEVLILDDGMDIGVVRKAP